MKLLRAVVLLAILIFSIPVLSGDIGKKSVDIYLSNLIKLGGIASDSITKLFIESGETPLLEDSTGLMITGSTYRYITPDRSTGWLCIVKRRHKVESNGNPAIWVYEISSQKIFEVKNSYAD